MNSTATPASPPVPRRTWPRRLARIGIAVVALLLVAVAAAALAVPLIDWNKAKGWVSAKASTALGRELRIGGDLAVGWHWDTSGHVHPWLPRLHVSAQDVALANWKGSAQATFAHCKRIEFDLLPWALAAHEIHVAAVHATAPEVHLERRADGSNNWTFNRDDGDDASGWHFRVGRVAFDAGHVGFDDAVRKLALSGEITPLAGPQPFQDVVKAENDRAFRGSEHHVGKHSSDQVTDERNAPRTQTQQPFQFAWKVSGKGSGRAVSGGGKFGALLGLQDDEEPWPMQGELVTGDTHIAWVGTLRNPSDVSALDLRLWVAGASMGDLYPLLRLTLPQTKAFSTDGHLSGEIHPHGNRFSYENFHGRVGDSDLSGTLTYDGRESQSRLTGSVSSEQLQLADLGPLVGAGGSPGATGATKSAKSPEPSKSSKSGTSSKTADSAPADTHRVLPTAHLHNERWAGMDAAVDFSAKRLLRGEALPISDIRTHIALEHAVLTLDPLHFAIAGGDADAQIRVDGNATPPRGKFHAAAHGLKLKELFPGVGLMNASVGEINGDVAFETHGVSVADLLGHADGEVKAVVDSGSVSKAALEKAGLNLANFALTRLTGDERVEINCAAADFALDDGVMQSKLVVFDTQDATVRVDGTISLRDETLGLTVHPDAKGVRVLSLRSPLKVTGTFEKPSIDVDKRSLLARGGGAIALAALAPVAALVPLTATRHDDNAGKGCQTVFTQLRRDDAAKAKPKKG